MEQKQFFELLLNLTPDWEIKEVRLNDADEVDIFIEYKLKVGICPITRQTCRIYDLRDSRRWRHLNVLQYSSYINCRVPRVINDDGKITTIEVPWADYSDRYTYLFADEVIKTLKLCKNQSKTARHLGITYDIVSSIMEDAVARGLDNRRIIMAPSAIGLDEKSFLKGHDYITVLTDIENGCILEVGRGRTIVAAEKVLDATLTAAQLTEVKAVVCDMSDAYMNVGKRKTPNAIQVADRFHLIKLLNEAVDKTRKQELKTEKKLLTHSKFALLKKPENLTSKQKMTFEAIDKANLRTARVWRAKENFRALFNQPDSTHAFISLNTWLRDVKHITLFHLDTVAKAFERHLIPFRLII